MKEFYDNWIQFINEEKHLFNVSSNSDDEFDESLNKNNASISKDLINI